MNDKTLDILKSRLDGEWKWGSRGARIRHKLHLEYGDRFDWPDMEAENMGSRVFCYGLRDQLGILWDGTVVPCCLDHEGDIALGNLFTQDMDEILNSPRAKAIYDGFTARQIAFFADMVEDLRAKGFRFKRVHIAASDAINNFPEAFRAPFTMARSGINLHGSFDPNGIKALKLKPVLSLKTRVAQVRRLPAGTTLGYGRTWKLDSERDIATISAGYADGLPMALANRGEVFIGGKRCPIVGRISMDYATVDVTGAGAVKCGDEVVCFGAAGEDAITPDDWAAIKGTHAYDILCSLGTRVARTVLGDT
jgi:hypothetical protein